MPVRCRYRTSKDPRRSTNDVEKLGRLVKRFNLGTSEMNGRMDEITYSKEHESTDVTSIKSGQLGFQAILWRLVWVSPDETAENRSTPSRLAQPSCVNCKNSIFQRGGLFQISPKKIGKQRIWNS
ncbi:hypothetical protein T265_10629 [Opisthorchis viverrini]|uniref:Uncharacterized protein n=1 Tax=Opisthorchis viverrini TaxID=6198 RepID=A0A075A0J5_OPIVI|nr:hypothetical protein T265_10629 [Opisthorchis viverrini]KER20944.1 hypothetical protein T265_10629 [Opisthorchis viverrini]